MAFTSLEFLFVFFPIAIVGYYLINNKLRNIFLLLVSLIYYAIGQLDMLWLLTGSVVVNYLMGLLIGSFENNNVFKKILLYAVIIFNFGILYYYKYFLFSIDTFNSVFGTNFTYAKNIILPLGVSFYTFRTVSYCLDVYWKTVKPQKNIIDVALYITFFPQVIMGPISKYNDFKSNLAERAFDFDNFLLGFKRIIIGLAKKLIIADTIGSVVDKVFAMETTERSVVLAWLGILGYIIQLYYDFSGYSDIAIGIGNLIGFKTDENFNYPYISKTVTEYWSRWHITLGTWLKNYLYTPIFRSCMDKGMTKFRCDTLALLGVWLFAGIWHGVGWNYLVYGLYYFAFIVFERICEDIKKKKRKKMGIKKQPKTIPQLIRAHVYFFVALIFGQLLFRSDSMTSFWLYFGNMFGIGAKSLCDKVTLYFWKQIAVVFIVGVIFSFPVVDVIRQRVLKLNGGEIIKGVVSPVIYGLMLIVAISFAFSGSYRGFIYFQF